MALILQRNQKIPGVGRGLAIPLHFWHKKTNNLPNLTQLKHARLVRLDGRRGSHTWGGVRRRRMSYLDLDFVRRGCRITDTEQAVQPGTTRDGRRQKQNGNQNNNVGFFHFFSSNNLLSGTIALPWLTPLRQRRSDSGNSPLLNQARCIVAISN
jgi:hypothetical protein